jgi:ribosome biogenesis GTPase A
MKIEWFPGHMNKASRQIAETIQGFDVIIEVLDARLPVSSANPLLEELRRGKPCIKVLNKNDLADPVVTKAWVRHFEKQAGVRALPLEARKRLEVGHLPQLCRRLAPHRGQPGKPLRAMVIGIPNVGKSTLINTLAGKAMARVGDRPAITTCPQQIDLRNGIRLSDTPGLLWPVMSDQNGAYRLAASGAIGESAMDYVQVALFAAAFMLRRYSDLLRGRYKLTVLPESPTLLLEEIGRRRGCLVSGGEVDLHRAAELFLRELRGGKLGRVSLEEPGQESGEEAVAKGNEDAPEGV